jgi:heme exporter protein D
LIHPSNFEDKYPCKGIRLILLSCIVSYLFWNKRPQCVSVFVHRGFIVHLIFDEVFSMILFREKCIVYVAITVLWPKGTNKKVWITKFELSYFLSNFSAVFAKWSSLWVIYGNFCFWVWTKMSLVIIVVILIIVITRNRTGYLRLW